ncbi:hypothetical protein VIBNISO65_1650023 [Vibrio nigripulchritudo SO65]|uniref:hypothetical protein n=2 Tax=Vibrio nigripulchritudo TaxID=28173 RepID=UPI0003B21676|nr:hypothetical protein [Vibrio nigripulchritudo]CCN38507.1 hypothetical protein VIBNIAM115_950022 [Vibrio nigripulchritudo AM115]CCN42450.1 hypothetical protein VIBNIFTn2_300023 [Vibrio nigripulchritudo FTn2]CCN67181.1 hypothetical protein VIBNIPon4_710022 [Vibrio nigripulchritudo POn4]CCN76754.1 hypothetical protein VIBNISO65_1650023 [Vibrio nigripulchritudo SO65]
MKKCQFDGIVLMGPFGAGKSFLGRHLNEIGFGVYRDLEPILYSKFRSGDDLNVREATEYIRTHYYHSLDSTEIVNPIFESTGIVQKPLLTEVMQKYRLALVKIVTPKEICLERVRKRNCNSQQPIESSNASEFYDNWMENIAESYDFTLSVDGTDLESATRSIMLL